jgi:spore maturation protein SpmA
LASMTERKGPQKNRGSAINIIWVGLVLGSILVALANGRMEGVTQASFESAKKAVELAIGLVGAMALWLGLMKVAEDAGLMRAIARGLRPVMGRLFPDVPPEHSAMSAMVMNISANIMGLGNAATPLGIKAMQELDRLNPHKGEATDAMCLFLAINTSSVTLLPLGVIAVRASAGASAPAAILLPTILATSASTLVAIVAAKGLCRLYGRREGPFPPAPESIQTPRPTDSVGADDAGVPRAQGWRRWWIAGFVMIFLIAMLVEVIRGVVAGEGAISALSGLTHWLIPFLMGILVVYGWSREVTVYESLCEGAKEGFQVAIRIIPFLVAILVAIGMFRESGALDLVARAAAPLTGLIGMPSETLPMALVRPLSGSGAFGIMSDLVARAPDSLGAFIASIMQGSTETTFYVLAIYFGSVQITRVRYALWAALMADAAGILAAVGLGHLFF